MIVMIRTTLALAKWNSSLTEETPCLLEEDIRKRAETGNMNQMLGLPSIKTRTYGDVKMRMEEKQ